MTDSDAEERLDLALKGLSVVRHDLRNLLASVTILANRMEESGDARLSNAAPMLMTSVQRIVLLGVRAGQIADAAPGKPQHVSLRQVAEEADPESAASLTGLGDLAVTADPEQLRVILGELIDNALRAGGRAVLDARPGEDGVALRVSDDGAGIPDYAQADLFTPFKGAKRRDGAGLGLPLAARLARLNGGALSLESTGEHGTVFRLDLPSG